MDLQLKFVIEKSLLPKCLLKVHFMCLIFLFSCVIFVAFKARHKQRNIDMETVSHCAEPFSYKKNILSLFFRHLFPLLVIFILI